MKRKLLFFCILGILFFCNLNLGGATYYGEEPYYSEGYMYVQFLEDGTFIIPPGVTEAEVLIVGGGGYGGGCVYFDSNNYVVGGGGGAGGLVLLEDVSSYEFNSTEINNGVSIIIGNGAIYDSGNPGGDTTFGSIVAKGGGFGGGAYSDDGGDGGSGGGGSVGKSAGDLYAGSRGEQIQTSQGGDSGTYGWGCNGGVGNGKNDGGGASTQDGPNGTYAGKTVWGVTYATGGLRGPITNGAGGANTGDGGGGRGTSSSCGGNPGLGYNGGSGIVVIRYEIIEPPEFIYPEEDDTIEDLKVPIVWYTLDDIDYYELRWDDNSSMSSYSTNTYTDSNTILYLANGDWYLDIRAKITDLNFTPWYSELNGDYYHFEKDDKPVFLSPDALETTPYIDFEWSTVNEVTGYDLRVYSDVGLTTLEYNVSNWSGSFPLTETFAEDEYWAIVRGRDNWYNGSWSDTLNFVVDLDEVAFDYTYNTINLYGGQTLTYDFTGMDANTTYTFKINKVTNAGVFNGNVTTKIVNSDANGSGTFSYTFPSNANYPFEVRLDDNNARLFYHYVARAPSPYFYDYIAGGHREVYNSTVLTVGIGDVVYNNKQGLMHDRTLTTQSLYEEGDYVLLHYSFPDSDDFPESQFIILINDMDTGDNMAAITSNDLFEYNKESANAATNFVVVSTSGVRPTIVDAKGLLDDYEGDNWSTLYLPKGAYDYIIAESQPESGDKVAFGESVLLIGDDSDVEWALSNSPASLKVGQKLTWTISCNTEEIWDSYNQMRFYDTPAGVYYIGSSASPYYIKHPTAYSSSFTLAYDTSDTNGLTGGVVFGVKPESTNFEEYLKWDMTWQNTYNYGYLLTKAYTLEEVPDATETLDSWLIDIGLGTAEGKLILSMALIAIIIVLCALIGVPVAGMALIALAAFIAFIAIGFIPIWTIVILVIAMVLMLIRQFSGGGGDE